MKQAIIRKTISGETEFRFPEKGKKFYVKNFSKNSMFVSFAPNSSEVSSFKLNGNMGEEFQMSYANRPWPYGLVYVIYVNGEGEVEVQSEDIIVPDDWEPEADEEEEENPIAIDPTQFEGPLPGGE